jgi:hypothetical protein
VAAFLAGIIDFGALFAGDPAWDPGAVWLLLTEGNASRFFTSYGQTDETTVRRARGPAAVKSPFLMLMGGNADYDLPDRGPACRRALDHVLQGLYRR